jgi:hypothetical protein
VLVLLVGLVGGAVLTAVAGARRTSTSADRFEALSRAADATVNTSDLDPATLDEVEQLPQVEAFGRIAVFFLYPAGGRADAAYLTDPTAFFASVDGQLGDTVERPRVLSGRLPDPDAVDEVVVSASSAASLALSVGDRIALRSSAFAEGGGQERGPDVELTVVGVGRLPADLASGPAAGQGYALLTPAFYRSYRDRIAHYEGIARVRLHGGAAALPAFTDAVQRIYGVTPEQFLEPVAAESAGVDDSIDVLVVGLLLFAAVAGLAGATAVGLALGRQAFATAEDGPTLRALGLSPRARFLVLFAPALPVAVAGATVAVAAAIAASPLMPIGIARRAEPDPGLSIDGFALGTGLAAVVVVVLALAALAAWRALRLAPAPDRSADGTWSAAVSDRLARLGLSPAPVTGVRFALMPGRGKTAVPVRAALVGTVMGLAGVVAVVVFAASLGRLVDTPARYGWTWDVTVNVPEPAESQRINEREFADELADDPDVGALATSYVSDMDAEGHPVPTNGFEQQKGTIAPQIVEGRVPLGPTEAALGTDTLDRLERSVGDRVDVTGPTATRTFEIVGRSVSPATPVGDAVSLTIEGYDSLGGHEHPGETSAILVRWAPGVDGTAASGRLQSEYGRGLPEGIQVVTGPTPPAEVEKLDQVEALPRVLAGFLALLAGLAVAHALVTAVRRRRRDLAILQTLGFVRRQVAAAVAWQATTTAAIGLLVGIPVGFVIGRAAWAFVADGIGVATDARVPLLTLFAVGAVTLLVANAVAAAPALAASRIRPAAVLRSE